MPRPVPLDSVLVLLPPPSDRAELPPKDEPTLQAGTCPAELCVHQAFGLSESPAGSKQLVLQGGTNILSYMRIGTSGHFSGTQDDGPGLAAEAPLL